jgi:F1F0 ATPase subunit 2
MCEALTLVLSGVAGGMLGVLFFGGLWWTVRKGLSSQRPALWFFGSLLLRMSIVLAGFYLVGRGHWERLVLCLFGFVMARLVVTLRLRSGQAWRTRLSGADRTHPTREASHAS